MLPRKTAEENGHRDTLLRRKGKFLRPQRRRDTRLLRSLSHIGVAAVSHCCSVLRYSNEDAKSEMDHPFCFQRQSPGMNQRVETVVVSFEFSSTLSLGRWVER
jgi:hypothetical protein